MKKLIFTILLFSLPSFAACTGSGTTWTCTAGSTMANVASALGSATDGAVITFASGSYTWTSGSAPFSSAKGATLICASVGTCNVTASGSILGMSSWSGTVTKLYRISGFNFTVSGSSTLLIWFGSGGGVTGTLTQVRVDHNTANMAATDIFLVLGENTSVTNVYGVEDHNTITSAGSIEALYMLGAVNRTPPANPLGTANNFFFEDNTLTVNTMTDGGLGAMDGWSCTMSVVFRHNVITNSLATAHGVTHGDGPCNVEVYNNTLIANARSTYTDGYRLFHHQGSGTMMVFNNILTASSGKNAAAISLLHYRDYPNGSDGVLPNDAAQCNGTVSGPSDQPEMIDGNRAPTTTNRGYPCFNQPGRDMFGNYKPIYSWNNAWSDTGAIVPLNDEDLGGSPDYKAQHMQANRDWYDAVSASAQTTASAPFNGTTGMGYGTLARRPATCTTNATEAGKGVGYFATDTGILYTCSATNTWITYYTPYTYPHPLVAIGSGPSPPINLAATVN